MREIAGIRIRGLVTCVPRTVVSNETDTNIAETERALLIRTTGVRERRVAVDGVTTVDLCEAAAKSLLESLSVKPGTIDLLVLVTQTGDYPVPASALLIQHRLGIPRTVMAFDVGMGCSGYVYGLAIVSSIMRGLDFSRALLLAGDVSTVFCGAKDKSTYPVFGDAGSATLLERDDSAEPMHFSLFSDGSGAGAIRVPHGGMKHPFSADSLIVKSYGQGIERSGIQLALDGLAVFNFATTVVPESLKDLIDEIGDPVNRLDYLVLHQANLLINRIIQRKLRLEHVVMPVSIDRFGNTSSASIPLTLASEISGELTSRRVKMLLSGFGIGLSWANAFLTVDPMDVVKIIEV